MNIISKILKAFLNKNRSAPIATKAAQEITVPALPHQIPAYKDIESDLIARDSCYYPIKEIKSQQDALACSIHANGYLREKSLRYLIANYQPENANRIFLRLSDWVEQVRRIADKWFVDNIDAFTLRELDKESDVLCFVFRKPAIKNRYIYQKFADHIHSKMEKCQKRHFYKLSLQFRKLIYEILQNQKIEILDFLKTDPAPVLMAIPLGKDYDSVPDDYIDAIIASGNWAARSKLYDYYGRKNIRPNEALLRESLTAKSYAIRSMAKFYLKMSEDELSEFYLSQPFPMNLFISDLKRDSDIDFLSKAFVNGNLKAREVVCDYIIEKCPGIITQEVLMEMYFGSSSLRRRFLRSLVPNIELPTLVKHKPKILLESNNNPLVFLDLVARVSKWKYLMELAELFQATSIAEKDLRFRLENHYYKTFESTPYYSRDPKEKDLALHFIRNLPNGVLPSQLLKRIEFDSK